MKQQIEPLNFNAIKILYLNVLVGYCSIEIKHNEIVLRNIVSNDVFSYNKKYKKWLLMIFNIRNELLY